mmetsp:Transcript_35814/g.113217  ORF Transcript_35814/g.113217 Transcript_35814/m.113217 type:complete len:157 (+) Transcript_35814:306-776(+)
MMAQAMPQGHQMGQAQDMSQGVPPGQPRQPQITTELIQKYLDENQTLILAILENQNLGKLSDCAQYQARLQQNLMYLAAIADAQPQPQAQAQGQAQQPAGGGDPTVASAMGAVGGGGQVEPSPTEGEVGGAVEAAAPEPGSEFINEGAMVGGGDGN